MKKGLGVIMGGQIIDYEAKRIKRAGILEGIDLGRSEGIAKQARETVLDFHKMNMDVDIIAKAVNQPSATILQWLGFAFVT